jgi:hypothetical protein
MVINWRHEERLLVAAHALPLVDDKQMNIYDAFMRAQKKCLHRSRWRERTSLPRSNSPSHGSLLTNALAEVRAMPPEQRPGYVAPLEVDEPIAVQPAPAPPPEKTYGLGGHKVFWTDREKALLAREIIRAGSENEVLRSGARAVFERAQVAVLPVDRRRPKAALYGKKRSLQNVFLEGKQRIWTLPPDEPETPEAPPAPEPVEAAAPVEAPTPLPTVPGSLSEAAKAFGDTMMSALDVLLGSHATMLMAEVQARLNRVASDVSDKLQANILGIVHASIERELGAIQPPPPAPAPESSHQEAPRQKLVIDVVGLRSDLTHFVREAFNNGDTDLRFIGPEASTWNPRSKHAVVLTKFTGHHVMNKCKEFGIKPTYANGAAASVIEAIGKLRQQHGTGAAH